MSQPPPRKSSAPPRENTSAETIVIGNSNNMPISGAQRLGQLWLWGVAILAIWSGLFTIAYSQGDSNNRFALLGLGGMISGLVFFVSVDMQWRKHGVITDLHDYMMAMSFFFTAAGMFWGVRYAVALFSSVDFTYFIHPDRPFTGMSSVGWYPNANAIYAQAAAAALLAALQWLYLKPMQNDERNTTTVSWFVVCITPFALLLVGLGTWVDWSDGFVSYEIGVAMVTLSSIAMMLSVESNNNLVFAITANVASFMTLIYEIVHSPPSGSSSGGALSLMAFIIIAQGLLAASPKLERKMVEKASMGLVFAALIAMIFAVSTEMTLHLGPSKFSATDSYLTLPTMIWITLLVAYLPAVHDNRIPWMPIGLAGALVLLPDPSNIIPWSICLVMIPYMLWNKKTREWVANWTFGLFAASFFVVGWLTWIRSVEGDADTWTAFPQYFDLIIAIVIIAVGELASRNAKLNRNVFRFALFCVVGSPATMIANDSLMPWLVALYLLGSVIIEQQEYDENGGFAARKDMSLTMATSLTLTVILAMLGRLSLSDTPLAAIESQLMGFNLLLAIIAVTYFVVGSRMSHAEFDLGIMLKMISKNAAQSASFDPTTGTWVVDEKEFDEIEEALESSWGQIARFSLFGPLILFTTAMVSMQNSELSDNPFLMLLFAIPVGVLVREVLQVEGAGSRERAVGVWSMVAISLPLSFKMDDIGFSTAAIFFDLIMINGPLIVHFVLLKRGLAEKQELSKSADDWTLLGMVALGMLDSTGGLALTVMFAIVLWRAILHRSKIALYALPLMWLFFPSRLDKSDNILNLILSELGSFGDTLLGTERILEIPYVRYAGLMWLIYAALALGKSAGDVQLRKRSDEEIETLPFIYPGIFLFLGLDLLLVQDAWLLCAVTTILLLFGWSSGRMEGFSFAPPAYFFSFLIGFDSEGYSGFELFSISCFGSGLVSFALWIAANKGLLYRWAKETITAAELNEGADTNLLGMEKLPSLLRCATQEGRDKLENYLRLWGMALLLFSFDEVYGLSTLFVAIWVTWEAWVKQERTLFLLTPMLHAIALWNIERVAEIQGNELAGWLLILEGAILSYLSAIKWYPDWNWSEDGDEYWHWNDMLGIFGATYGVVGILWALWDLTDIGASLLIILYCGMQAAADFETTWRRITSLVGTSLGTFLVFFSDVGTTFAGISLIVGGLAAFAQAVLYFRVWGIEEGTLKLETVSTQVSTITAESSEEEIEVKEKMEPVIESSQVEDDDTDEIEDFLDSLEDETSGDGDLDEGQDDDVAIPTAILNRVTTSQGFDIELPPQVMQNILQTLENTDTEGFQPVIGFDQFGRIIMNFEPADS